MNFFYTGEFDESASETVEYVMADSYDEAGNADPSMITIVYKTGDQDRQKGDGF